ncbi:HD-GYP domain-containing protein [Ureibacillus sp. Re31]|uniref:HD-GYP domain-containing protein n=1 Tax=Ureibacillus galli TaxID=2762222 RepID=A0ABR8XGJ8_9BACL|nr:HD-GYP domain-containing protein [Ureibacillus galli]MBD8028357.1 HD-GYP domain-containing protein [Ureibacillus galli]
MRLISINVLKKGMVIGRTIWNEAGLPLLQRNVVVTDPIIQRLKQLGIQYVYIEDEISKGIIIEETVPLSVRKKSVKQITESFNQLKGLSDKSAALVLDKKSKEIGQLVDNLLPSILNSNEILTVLTDTLIYDEYIFQHSFQVTIYSLAIAKELGYSRNDLKTIGIGALLHDVGKMLIPSEILFKQSRLTDEEFEIMKQHTRTGFDILRNIHTISLLVAHCAFQHHERIDGSGYPRGLVDSEIHPYAKIIAVADVFDAVTTNRVYRNKMLPSQGIAIIEEGRGTIFDERVVDAFKKSVVHYPNGTILMLSDGRRGIVVEQNSKNAALPSIRIFEENQERINNTYVIHLADEPNVKIEKVESEYIEYIE